MDRVGRSLGVQLFRKLGLAHRKSIGDISALNFLIDSPGKLVTRLQNLEHKCISSSFFFNLECQSITGRKEQGFLNSRACCLDPLMPLYQRPQSLCMGEGCLKQRKLRSEFFSHTSYI